VVGSASGGAEAIELAAALEPAVVVIDLAMPGTSGVEAIRAICRRRFTGFSMCQRITRNP
jgi:DNA-binding NarL/FixJ family response regulator